MNLVNPISCDASKLGTSDVLQNLARPFLRRTALFIIQGWKGLHDHADKALALVLGLDRINIVEEPDKPRHNLRAGVAKAGYARRARKGREATASLERCCMVGDKRRADV